MSQYGPGTSLTCSVTNGSSIVTFSAGTELQYYVAANDWFTLDDDESTTIQIQTVDNDLQLTLAANWAGESAIEQHFIITTDFTSRRKYPIFHQGDKRVGKNLARLVAQLDDDMAQGLLDTVCLNNLTYSGSFGEVIIDSNTQGFGNALCLDVDGHYEDANATDTSKMPCIALALTTETGNDKKVLFRGFIKNNAWSWTPRALLYVNTTNGQLTHTQPSGSGQQVQVIGQAISATLIYLNPSMVLVERE